MLQPRFCFLAISYQLINETSHLDKLFLRPQDIFTALAPINDEEQRLSGASPSRGNPNGFFDFFYFGHLFRYVHITKRRLVTITKVMSSMAPQQTLFRPSLQVLFQATRQSHPVDLESASHYHHHLSL